MESRRRRFVLLALALSFLVWMLGMAGAAAVGHFLWGGVGGTVGMFAYYPLTYLVVWLWLGLAGEPVLWRGVFRKE